MTDLEKFQAEATPRSVALCEPYVRKFVPVFGIVMWGIVYAFFSPLPAIAVASGIAAAVRRLAPQLAHGASAIVVTAAIVVVLAAYFAAWIPFALWARRWRASRRRCLREGVLLEASFMGSTYARDEDGVVTWDHFRFTHNGKARSTKLVRVGEHFDDPVPPTVTVLYHPGFSFGGQFFEGVLRYSNRWGGDVQPTEA